MIDSILLLLIIISIGIGAFFLYKYKKTKQKKFLILGIILTFVIPGILFLILLWWWYYSSTMVLCYMPIDPGDGSISTIIGIPLFLKQRDEFVNKYKDKVPKNVLKKITKKKK